MDIIGIGTPIMDLVVNVDSMPQRDGATHANEMFYQGGNKVPTAMVAAARLGWKAGLVGRVGRDRIGRFILEDLEYNQVDTSRIVLDEEGRYSSCCLSLSEKETGTRVFIGRSSTVRPITPDLLDYDYLATAKCIHLSEGDEGSVAAAAFGKEKGIPVSLDGDHYNKSIEELIPKIDVFIGSEFFQRDLFGSLSLEESCREIVKMGPHTAIFTLGKRGCVGYTQKEGFFALPCFDNVTVVDTTGAGDVFHGAYIVAMLEGKSAQEACRFASAVSAIKCTRIGGRTGIPTRPILDRFLETGEIDGTELDERLAYYRTKF